jgi:hypothetical protein
MCRPGKNVLLTIRNSVGMALSYGLEDGRIGVRYPSCLRDSSPQRLDRLRGPSSFLCNEYRSLLHQGVRRLGREAHNLFLSSADVKDY